MSNARVRSVALAGALIGAAAIVTSTVGPATTAHAATITWSGASTFWSNTNAWVGNVAPQTGDSVVFPASPASTTSFHDVAGSNLASVAIEDAGYAISTTVSSPMTVGTISANYTGTSTFDVDVALGGPTTVDVVPSAELVMGGDLTGSGNLTIQGGGTARLTGSHTGTGTTTVNGSTLRVDGTITSAITASSGTITGSGTTGPLTVGSGSTVSPGVNSTAILNTGNLSIPSGATFVAAIDGTTPGTGHDQLNVTGTVALGGDLALSSSLTPSGPTSVTLIANDGTDPVTGQFNGIGEGSAVVVGGTTWSISYVGGTGNDVTASVAFSTTVTLTSSNLSSTIGQPITLTATISPSFHAAGSTVHFREGPTLLGTGVVDSSGQATLTLSSLSVGTHSLAALYIGNPLSGGNISSSISQVVTAAPTTTASPTTTTVVPTTTPPTTATPTSSAPTTTLAAGAGTLPSTGDGSSSSLALLAGLSLLAGIALTVTRRRTRA